MSLVIVFIESSSWVLFMCNLNTFIVSCIQSFFYTLFASPFKELGDNILNTSSEFVTLIVYLALIPFDESVDLDKDMA